jgi:hypothetical protein
LEATVATQKQKLSFNPEDEDYNGEDPVDAFYAELAAEQRKAAEEEQQQQQQVKEIEEEPTTRFVKKQKTKGTNMRKRTSDITDGTSGKSEEVDSPAAASTK